MLYVPSILYGAIAVRYSVLSPPAPCAIVARLLLSCQGNTTRSAAYIANYISIEFSRTDNFVPLPTLRQLKYVSPNVKPLTVELLDVFCSVFAVGFAITRYPASRYSSQRHIDWHIAKEFVFYRFFINGFK